MDEDDQNNLFGTFEAVIQSAYNEKKDQPAWKDKIAKADIKANLALQVGKDEFFYVHLVIQNGNVQFNKGKLDGRWLELLADPQDLLFFANKTYSILDMVLKKNQYGFPKMRVKNGGKNIGKLLFVSSFLTF